MKIITNNTYEDIKNQIKQGDQIKKDFANYRKKCESDMNIIKEERDKLLKQNTKLSQELTKEKMELKSINFKLETTTKKLQKMTGQKGGLKKENNKLKEENKRLKEQNENYKSDILKNHPKLTVKEYEQRIKKVRK